MTGVLIQILQFALVLAIAPAVTGLVRKIKARLCGRVGAPILQPYRDVARLLVKAPQVSEHASFFYRLAPSVSFLSVLVAAGLIPTLTLEMALAPTSDLIALTSLLAIARFATALAGLDVGTSFGGLGASRDMMIGALAEPAMLMVTFTVALVAQSTGLDNIVAYVLAGGVGVEISLAMALIALALVAIAENGRIPVDNPATHLELTMVHEAMVLDYSGRHLALVEGAQMVKLVLYLSLIGALFFPWSIAAWVEGPLDVIIGLAGWITKLAVGAALLALFETSIAKMRVFRVPDFLGAALLLAALAAIFRMITDVVT